MSDQNWAPARATARSMLSPSKGRGDNRVACSRDRVVVVDHKTKGNIWQYGVTGRTGIAQRFLNCADDFGIYALRDGKMLLAGK